MAFKKEILAALKTKHKKASKVVLEKIADHLEKSVGDDEESKITEVVEGADGLVSMSESIALAEGDRRVNVALKNAGIPIKKEDDDDPEPAGKGKDSEDMPAYMKTFMKQQEAIAKELADLKTEKTVNARKTALEKKLAEAPEDWKSDKLKSFNRMTFKDDEDFDSYLEEVETDAKAAKQASSNKGLSGLGKPLLGNRNEQGVSASTAAYVEARKNPAAAGNDLGGKKI